MVNARATATEDFKNTIGARVAIPEDIPSNGGKRVIWAGEYDVIQATGRCLCLGYWVTKEDGSRDAVYAGWLDYRITDEDLELWTKGYEEEQAQENNLLVASEIKDLVLPEWTVQEAPKAKTPRCYVEDPTPRKAPVRKYAGTTHGKWYVDENTMTCHPKSGKAWKVLKVVRPGEEWIVTNGNKTGVLTQNRWDNIEK